MRWNVEVTFEESRAHLGLESQRQWHPLAIARLTPAVLGLFSLVVLLAQALTHGQPLPTRSAAWYRKSEPPFSDVLAFVRAAKGRHRNSFNPLANTRFISFPASALHLLLETLSYVT